MGSIVMGLIAGLVTGLSTMIGALPVLKKNHHGLESLAQFKFRFCHWHDAGGCGL